VILTLFLPLEPDKVDRKTMPISEKIYSKESKKFVKEGTTLKAGQLTVTQIPPVAISWSSTRVFATGSWSQVRPHFQHRLAPCRERCPVSEDIEEVLQHVQEEDWEAAWRTIIRENPMPAVCGRVCIHPCEAACNRGQFDQPVGIHHIEREIGDFGIKKHLRFKESKLQRSIFRVAVVGSGPAGLATSYHLTLFGHQVVLYESQTELGGLLRWGIPEFRLPKNVLKSEIDRIINLGIEFHTGVLVGSNSLLKDLLSSMDAVFLAPGAAVSHRLTLANENAKGIWAGSAFLNSVNKGDKPDLGNDVLVIGGGNTAIDSARAARRLGANVTILYHRNRDEMPAHTEEIEEALQEGVNLEILWEPIRIEIANGRVNKLTCVKMRLGEPDSSGRRNPIPIEGLEQDFPATAILNAIDEATAPELIAGDMSSALKGDSLGRTEIPNLFVGRDFGADIRTVAYALGSGKRAALLIDRFLHGENPPTLPEKWKVGEKGGWSTANANQNDQLAVNQSSVKFAELNTAYFNPVARRHERMSISQKPRDFDEARKGIGPTNAIREAERCFNCGHCNHCGNCIVFCPEGAISAHGFRKLECDYNYCKGCGVCAEECPRNAIALDPIK
jgi:2-oxoacid:acceptor oxidoreductase delta subunit (pyruvate/2-ketoisovalerate family)